MRFRAKDGMIERLGRRLGTLVVIVLAAVNIVATSGHGEPLYDRDNPAFPYLQSPAEAFDELPPSDTGNLVDWVEALNSGKIQPWPRFFPTRPHRASGQPSELDLDVVMSATGDLPPVVFSHATHTALLQCESCHPALIRPLRATNRHPMAAMVEGESCGLCHGTVAFPLADCAACHRPLEDQQ